MSRVGAGWAARWGTVALVVGLTVSGLVGVARAQAAGSYQLLVSASADRSAATPLDGATVSGNIYAFTSPETSVLKSVFYIDDPAASGTAFHSEGTGPYDLNGGSAAAAAPYDTHLLSDGTHTITQVVTNTAKVVETDTATITVNNSVALPPAPTGVTPTSGNGYVDLVVGGDDRVHGRLQRLPRHVVLGQPLRYAAQRRRAPYRYQLPRRDRHQRHDVLLRRAVRRQRRTAQRVRVRPGQAGGPACYAAVRLAGQYVDRSLGADFT